jgi:hypothetical protein
MLVRNRPEQLDEDFEDNGEETTVDKRCGKSPRSGSKRLRVLSTLSGQTREGLVENRHADAETILYTPGKAEISACNLSDFIKISITS